MAERRNPLENHDEQYETPSEGVPEYYIDSLHIQTQLYTSVLYLGENPTNPEDKPRLRLKVKLSPQMLKAMSLLMGKQIREYEQSVGPISLPKAVLHGWGLEEEL